MGQMYAWAMPEYLLDHMTLEEVFFYYDQGVKFEEFKAQLIIAKLGEALEDPKKRKQKTSLPNKPDKAAFYQHYGDRIKRPNKGGESK